MPPLRISVRTERQLFERGFAELRREFGIDPVHRPAVHNEAARQVRSPQRLARADRRALALLAVDPPGARDLDQAFTAERRGSGYRVWYAIADLGEFVEPGGAVDRAAHRRGVTLYAPDLRATLHPAVLSEGAASLLPGRDRPAVLWRVDLDGDGSPVDVGVERARVRVAAAMSYATAQEMIGRGADDRLTLLAEIGRLRQERERERGGVSINLPGQIVARDDDGYRLVYDRPLVVEDWNAQISLLTGMVAAQMMLDGGRGVLRTLPDPDADLLDELRRRAGALRLRWPVETGYAAFVSALDGNHPDQAAMLNQALRGLRGAGYAAFDGSPPEVVGHAGVAAPYAHVTAPLRRLVDRYGLEICLAAAAGRRPAEWVLADLPGLPEAMNAARRTESRYERAIVDFVETVVLRSYRGRPLAATVIARSSGRTRVMLHDPAVIADAVGDSPAAPGDSVEVVVGRADLERRRVELEIL